uniref:RRM domain-containing protein n=2 Tax=Meloidogyne TaxID=189290 RepID=A0A6V7UHI6_MELEN|nr:unnamed protein product [Meloidogyne enterolobii]
MVRDSRSRSSSINRSRSPRRRDAKKSRRRSRSGSRSTFSRTPSPGAKRLHIGNLDDTIRRCDIEDVFGKYGRIVDCWMASYPPFYGFVVFDRNEDAQRALRDMSTGYIKDCRVRTTVALPRYGGSAGRVNNRGGRLPPPPGRGPRRNFDDDYGRGGRRRRSRSRSVRRHRRRSPSISRSRSPVSPKRSKHRRSVSNDRGDTGKNNGNENIVEGVKKVKREKRSMSRSSNNSSNNGRQRLRRSASHSSKSD